MLIINTFLYFASILKLINLNLNLKLYTTAKSPMDRKNIKTPTSIKIHSYTRKPPYPHPASCPGAMAVSYITAFLTYTF